MALRDTARAVLERKGYANTTLRDIIEASDITHPTFYKYFDSKDAVLADLIDGLVDELMGVALPSTFPEAAKRSRVASSMREVFRGGMRGLLQLARANKHLVRAIREAIHASPSHARHWAQFRDRALALVESDLGWMERAGLIRSPHHSLLATVMVQTIEAAIFELAARDEWDLEVIEAVLEGFYWNALFGSQGGPIDFVVVRGKRPRPVFASAPNESTSRQDLSKRRV